MGLYIYDKAHFAALGTEIHKVNKCCKQLTTMGLDESLLFAVTRALTHHRVLVVPTDVQHLTPLVARIQQIGQLLGVRSMPLAAYMANNVQARTSALAYEQPPVAATAVPPTQQPAAAGKPITTNA